VRNLEREIGRIARKVVTKLTSGELVSKNKAMLRPSLLAPRSARLLGKPRFHFEAALRTEKAGVATGLAVTPVGGDVLFVEAACMPARRCSC